MAKSRAKAVPARTQDSFQNFMAHVGQGTGNQNDASGYGFNPVTRNRMQIDWCYRGSWIAGRAVDCVAQDMTREGIEINSSDKPDRLQELDKEAARLQIWKQLCQTIKWSRLYGGAVAFLMIDGQKPETPLRMETVGKDQFKGLLPLDRWTIQPSLSDLVTEYGPQYGQPKFYTTTTDANIGVPRMKIHHSRVIRMEGVELPRWQKISENWWGQSVLERLWDRLIAFDSTTTGVAQLVYKAHLRTYAVEGLRDIISAGGPAMKGLVAQIAMIRAFQTNEGLTLMDAKDKFETHQYAFSGLDAVLIQFGEQLCGALEIPAVRLFGQSPAGFNSGDADLKSYWDGIKQQQVATLGPGVETLYRVLYISKFGTEPPKQFEIDFKPLYQLSDEEESRVVNQTTAAIVSAYQEQIIDRPTAMRELKQLSRTVGTFSNISDESIKEAEKDPAPTPEALGLETPKPIVKIGEDPNAPGKPAEKPNLRAVS